MRILRPVAFAKKGGRPRILEVTPQIDGVFQSVIAELKKTDTPKHLRAIDPNDPRSVFHPRSMQTLSLYCGLRSN